MVTRQMIGGHEQDEPFQSETNSPEQVLRRTSAGISLDWERTVSRTAILRVFFY